MNAWEEGSFEARIARWIPQPCGCSCERAVFHPRRVGATRGRDARRGISSARKADGGTSRMGMSPVRGTRQIGVLTLTHWFRITVVVLRINRTRSRTVIASRPFRVVRFTNDPFVLTPEPDVGSSLEVCRASVQRRNAAMNAEIYRYPLALPASTFPRSVVGVYRYYGREPCRVNVMCLRRMYIATVLRPSAIARAEQRLSRSRSCGEVPGATFRATQKRAKLCE